MYGSLPAVGLIFKFELPSHWSRLPHSDRLFCFPHSNVITVFLPAKTSYTKVSVQTDSTLHVWKHTKTSMSEICLSSVTPCVYDNLYWWKWFIFTWISLQTLMLLCGTWISVTVGRLKVNAYVWWKQKSSPRPGSISAMSAFNICRILILNQHIFCNWFFFFFFF